jgi:putative oxidoreductase
MLQMLDRWKPWALVPLRMIIGFGFFAHGYAKLSRGVGGFGGVLGAIGVPAPLASAWLTTLVEIVGGLAIVAGVYVPFAVVPLVIVMLTAMFTVHLPNGFSSIKLMSVTAEGAKFGPPGYELNLVYIAALVTLALGGASPYSFDSWRANRRLE